MDNYVSCEERHQEPTWWITVLMTHLVNMRPRKAFDSLGKCIWEKQQKTEINHASYHTPCDIRCKLSLGFVLYVLKGIARNGLVEIACLEEKETHEEETPCHQLPKPELTAIATHTDYVQQHHS